MPRTEEAAKAGYKGLHNLPYGLCNDHRQWVHLHPCQGENLPRGMKDIRKR